MSVGSARRNLVVRALHWAWFVAAAVWAAAACGVEPDRLRPPAVPLVTHDPYTSCWPMSDRLYDDWPRHWTGRIHAICSLIHVDEKPQHFMGICPEVKNTVTQASLEVRAP